MILDAVVMFFRITLRKHRDAGLHDDAFNVLQRKISRIILTNGCCWIPICIMAFLSAAGIVGG